MSSVQRILLVEDNDDHAELVVRSLEEQSPAPTVTRLRDGAAALDYLFRRGEFAAPESSPRPDLVLLDLRLPRVDGLEVLRKIKAAPSLQELPVVVLTSSEAERDLDEAYSEHANAYLVKPADFASIAAMMRDAGSFWLRWNRRAPS